MVTFLLQTAAPHLYYHCHWYFCLPFFFNNNKKRNEAKDDIYKPIGSDLNDNDDTPIAIENIITVCGTNIAMLLYTVYLNIHRWHGIYATHHKWMHTTYVCVHLNAITHITHIWTLVWVMLRLFKPLLVATSKRSTVRNRIANDSRNNITNTNKRLANDNNNLIIMAKRWRHQIKLEWQPTHTLTHMRLQQCMDSVYISLVMFNFYWNCCINLAIWEWLKLVVAVHNEMPLTNSFLLSHLSHWQQLFDIVFLSTSACQTSQTYF